MLNTIFFNKTQYLRNCFWIFFILLNWTGPTHLGLGQTRSDHEQWRHSLLFTLHNSGEQPKRRRRGRGRGRGTRRWWTEGRWKSRRPVTLHCSHARWIVESELIHSPLFTLQNSGECRRQTKEKEKGKGKSNAAVGTMEAVVKGSCSPLMDGGPSFFLCFCSSPSLFLAASCLQNKQSRNVALRKACRNSFYKTDFWTHFMVGAMHENCIMFCNQTRWNHG